MDLFARSRRKSGEKMRGFHLLLSLGVKVPSLRRQGRRSFTQV
jgi:hypothetical protein